jgi:peptidoglycan/LPS O-acetylase OafA/YrhL
MERSHHHDNQFLPNVMCPETQRAHYYRPELDILRFVAFLMVFASHSMPGDEAFYGQLHIPPLVSRWIISLAASGAFGVDLFFALSSYLITTLLLREHQATGGIDIRAFYLRRVLRIWPLYFVFLLAVAPLVDSSLGEHSFSLGYVLAFVLLAGNWACVIWGYPHSVAGPLWSVSIEEQFYVFWPLLLRRWLNHWSRLCVFLLAISFVTRVWLVLRGVEHPQIWCNTLARLDPIACGALLAMRLDRKEYVLPPGQRVLLVISSLMMLALSARLGDFTGWKALVTYPVVTLASVTLIISTLGWRLKLPLGVVARFVIYLGRISYGLYVFHLSSIFMLGVWSTHGPVQRPTAILSALLATILVAAISYRVLETPFLRMKTKLARVSSEPIRLTAGRL